MKRTISILLVALMLLVALPTFAEGEMALQPGLYVAEGGSDVLYLDEKGVGVLNYDTGEQQLANGVVWTASTMEVERAAVPFAVVGETVVFTFDGAVRIFRYAGAGEAYALGDGENTAFAGTYLADDGRKLVLSADGEGVFTDAAGDSAVYWGGLLPYWPDSENVTENTCYVLFDSYLSGMTFADGVVVVEMENEGEVTFVRQAAPAPAPSGDGDIYYGLRMTAEGQTMDLIPFLTAMGMDPKAICLELRPDGTGFIQIMDAENSSEFTWTDTTFTVDGESIAYAWEGDHILLSIEGETLEFAPAAEFEKLLGNDVQVGDEPAPANSDDPLVGTWTFTKVRTMGMEVPASMMGTSMSIILNADGTAAMVSDGSSTDLEWSMKDESTVALSIMGSEVFTLAYNGTELNLITGADGVDMIFEKDS